MNTQVQAQIFPSDDTHIIIQGTEEKHREYYEYFGREFSEIEVIVTWTTAFCADTLKPIPLSDWLEWLADFEELEPI